MGCKCCKVCRKPIPCRKREENPEEKEKSQEERQIKQTHEEKPKKTKRFYRLVNRILGKRRKEKEHKENKCVDKVIEEEEAKVLLDPTPLPDLVQHISDTSSCSESAIELQKESHHIESIDNGIPEEPCNAIVSVPEPVEIPPQLTVFEDSQDRQNTPEEHTEEQIIEDEKCPDPLQWTESFDESLHSESVFPQQGLKDQEMEEEDNISIIELMDIPPTPVSDDSDSSEHPSEEFSKTSEDNISIIELMDIPPTPVSEDSDSSEHPSEEFSKTSEESDSIVIPPEEISISSESKECISIIELADIPPTPAICEEAASIQEIIELPPIPTECEESDSSILPPEEFNITPQSEESISVTEIVDIPPTPAICEDLGTNVQKESESLKTVKYIMVKEAKESLESSEPRAPAPDNSQLQKMTSLQEQSKKETAIKNVGTNVQKDSESLKTVKYIVVKEAKESLDNTKSSEPPAPDNSQLQKMASLQEQRKKETAKKILKSNVSTPKKTLKTAAASRKPAQKETSKSPEGRKHVSTASPEISGSLSVLKKQATKEQVPMARIMQRKNMPKAAVVSRPLVKKDTTKQLKPPTLHPVASSGVRATMPAQGPKTKEKEEKAPRGKVTTPRQNILKSVAKPIEAKDITKQPKPPARRPVAASGVRATAQEPKTKEKEEQAPRGKVTTPRQNILKSVAKPIEAKDITKQPKPPARRPVAASGVRATAQEPKTKEKEEQVSCRPKITPSLQRAAVKKIQIPKESPKPVPIASSGISKTVTVQEQKTKGKKIKKRKRRIKKGAKKVLLKKQLEKDSLPEAPKPDSASSPNIVANSAQLLEQILEVKETIHNILEPVESTEEQVASIIPVNELEKYSGPSIMSEFSESTSEDSSDLSDEELEDLTKEAKVISDTSTERIPEGASSAAEADDSVVEQTSVTSENPLIEERVLLPSYTCFEDFTLDSVLGSGLFGKVYLVEHKAKKKMFAMKTLPKEETYNSGMSNFQMELRILKMVTAENHHFLTGLSAYFQTDHHICLVMDYAAQGSLLEQLMYGPFSLERTIFSTACMVLGLQFLHDRDIVHRDLKLGNVLMEASGYVKIADFGLCDDITRYKSGIMSHCTRPCRANDWQAVGVMIYEMLLGDVSLHFKLIFGMDESSESLTEKYPESFTPETCSILNELLHARAASPLRPSEIEAEDLKRSTFFMNLDWEALLRREVKPPVYRKSRYSFQFTREPALTLDSPV